MRRKTLALDFDGVIHRYSQGWMDGTIYDPPMDGALEGIEKLMETYNVFVFTTRDKVPVAIYLNRHGFRAIVDMDNIAKHRVFWNTPDTILVTNKKLAAHAYIDDRGIRFTGWPNLLETIEDFV